MSKNTIDNLSLQFEIGSISLRIFLENSFWHDITSFDIERHCHSVYEFNLITSGSGNFSVDNKTESIFPGTIYIIKQGVFHLHKSNPDKPIKKYCFKFTFKLTKNHDLIEEASYINNILNNDYVIFNDTNNLGSIINIIHSELTNKNLFYYSRIQQLFGQIFISIFREITVRNFSQYNSGSEMIHEDRINIIEDFFDHCYEFNYNPQELCSKLFISPSQLNRILKKLYNKSFKQKMMEVRMEYMKFLLENTDIPVKFLFEKAGYSSEENFSTAFKKATGISPSYYRKNKK